MGRAGPTSPAFPVPGQKPRAERGEEEEDRSLGAEERRRRGLLSQWEIGRTGRTGSDRRAAKPAVSGPKHRFVDPRESVERVDLVEALEPRDPLDLREQVERRRPRDFADATNTFGPSAMPRPPSALVTTLLVWRQNPEATGERP